MSEDCWIIDMPVRQSKQALNWLTETVGERQPGELFQHLCEIAREANRCIRPEHVVIGTKSTNAAHMHELRRRAGQPWTGGRKQGEKMGPYWSTPWRCHCEWEGTRHSAPLHRKQVHGEIGPVPPSAGS